jgi:signal transduction histidine kinase
MKLINHTLLFLSAILLVTVSLWAVLFYYQLMTHFKATVDEGLANYKIVLIDKLKDDRAVSKQDVFAENIYIIRSVSEDYALQVRDSYKDTLLFSSIKNKSYHTRLLTTAFVATDGKYFEMKLISQELDHGKLIKNLATSLLWLFLFLFISSILVNNFVLKKTWKPFYELLKYLNDFSLEKNRLHEPSKTKIKEFILLNKSIQNLLRTSADSYNSQKQFIENASHELQTPLAIGINKLELLAGEEGLSEEQIGRIGNIIEVLQRLSNLNKSLLLLSKIDNKQFIAEEQLSFNEIFSRIIADFSDFSDYRRIRIIYHSEDIWHHRINKELADILVMNLLKNAIFHNRQGGEVIIRISTSSFTIENTSDEPQMMADKLFVRFNQTARSKNSTGLGLSIAKAIADASGLFVTYAYNGRHSFSISTAPQ